MIPSLGATVKFVPSAYSMQDNGSEVAKECKAKNTVTGRVTMIHWRHKWYMVSYPTDYNGIQHECFHFYP